MNPLLLSQRDPKWANLPLGTSSSSIGYEGCLLTALGMKFGLTPDIINQRLNAVDGFLSPKGAHPSEKKLVIWKKLDEALPGVKFTYRHYQYNNEVVKQNLPCLVEVNGAPIGGSVHWVLYIGNQQLHDPFDGKVKSTASYPQPLGFALVSGQASLASSTPTETFMYRGIDMRDTANVKRAIDVWADVANGQYVRKVDHEEMQRKYNEFVALGYNTVEDIQKKLSEADETNTRLLQDIVVIEKKNESLANSIASDSKNSYTAVEEALKKQGKLKELEEGVAELAKVTEVEKPTMVNILSRVLNYKDWANKFIQEKEKNDHPAAPPQQPEEKSGITSVFKLFKLL